MKISPTNFSGKISAAGTNELRTAASFDYETKSSYPIRVRSTDSGGLYTEQAFTVTVTNVADAVVAVLDVTPNPP